jgi:hypothetical protein
LGLASSPGRVRNQPLERADIAVFVAPNELTTRS